MERILSIINKEGFNCLAGDVLNLDIERFVEYRDSEEHPAEDLFERPIPSTKKKKIKEIGLDIPLFYVIF